MKNQRYIVPTIALLIQSMCILSCSSPKVLSRSTQAIDFDSLRNFYSNKTDKNIDYVLTSFRDYGMSPDGSSFNHMVERHNDTLTLYYGYREKLTESTNNTYNLYYSVKTLDKKLCKLIKRYENKPLCIINDPKRYNYIISTVPLNTRRKTHLGISPEYFDRGSKAKRKLRQTRALFKRIAKRYYDIPKEYIKY